jgi:hypothetical protein
MIKQFFRIGRARITPRNNEDPPPPHDGKWVGDCIVCRTTFNYTGGVTLAPLQIRLGGFCYRCHQEYCPSHVRWEKSEFEHGEAYDLYNAICPNCNILLNTHQPLLSAIDEKLKRNLPDGLDQLNSLINLLKARRDNAKEIQRLEMIHKMLQ